MKILALYLPQFHKIKENDEWWGENFTEWTNVKKAKPIYKGHQQPIVPLDKNYYDLSKKETLIWQSKLAKRFGVSGFVIYHYWYMGKLMLEKPSELLLMTREADIEYCFCWANHPWTRSWDGKEHQILQAQTYGNEEDWLNHINYYLPFFKDTRYIKKDNRPILFIYNTGAIHRYVDMIEYWETELKKHGFEGIRIIEFISSKNTKAISREEDEVFEDEPIFSCRFEISCFLKVKRLLCKILNKPDYLNYDKVWKKILNKKSEYGKRKIVQGAFCSFDNSPRRGKKGCFVIKNSNPEKFRLYFKQLLESCRCNVSKDFVVINAWNEWGEGAMLEPSDQFGFSYLKSVKAALDEVYD